MSVSRSERLFRVAVDGVALPDADRLSTVLTAWFGSPFWGARPRNATGFEVAAAGPRAAWDAPHGLLLLAEALRRPAATSASGTATFVDRAAHVEGEHPIGTEQLADPCPLVVRESGHRPRIVPGLAGLLGHLLLRRLDVRVGERVLRALVGPSAPEVGATVPWPADAPVPAHLLLPTAAGAALRALVGADPAPMTVPPVAFTAAVGHLAGTPVDVRAGRIDLLQWLVGGSSRWDPALVLRGRPLAVRRAALAAVRRLLLPATLVVSLLPARPRARTVRWPLRLIQGGLPVIPATTLVDAGARGLVRGD